MKITKEMVAKHIMNQDQIAQPYDETKKYTMAFCYSKGRNIVFKDIKEEELKEWGALDKDGYYDTDFENLENKNFMRICQELADDYNAEYEDQEGNSPPYYKNTNLKGADFRNANLENVDFEQSNLTQAIFFNQVVV